VRCRYGARMRRLLPAVAITAAMSLTACGDSKPAANTETPSSAPAVFTITGSITLGLGNFLWSSADNTCVGRGGYDDMKVGTQVVVTDPAGVTLAVGAISDGSPKIGDRVDDDGEELADGCELSFFVDGVPAGKGIYGVEVSHRGRLQYPEAQAREDLQLTLD